MRTEERGRRNGDGGTRTEERGRRETRTEEWRNEDGGMRDGGMRTEERGRRNEDGGTRTEERGRRNEDGGDEEGGTRTEERGRRNEDGGTKDGGTRTEGTRTEECLSFSILHPPSSILHPPSSFLRPRPGCTDCSGRVFSPTCRVFLVNTYMFGVCSYCLFCQLKRQHARRTCDEHAFFRRLRAFG